MTLRLVRKLYLATGVAGVTPLPDLIYRLGSAGSVLANAQTPARVFVPASWALGSHDPQ